MDVIFGKLKQLRPQMSNVVIVQAEIVPVAARLQAALNHTKLRIEQRDAVLLARHAFRDPADFVKQYERLNVVLLRPIQLGAQPLTVWINRQARVPLPSRALTSIVNTHTRA